MNKKIIGNFGENVAKKYLETKGYAILETNWHYHHKELDIIAYKNKIIGIEIKTRTKTNNPPQTILKPTQLARLRLSLRAYCQQKGFKYHFSRLDLITITVKNKNTVILKHQLDI